MDQVTDLPEWVDGPRFAEWLDVVRPDYRTELTEHLNRTIARLREPGTKGRVDTIDRICVDLSLHISEIPEDIWTTPPNRGRRVNERRRSEVLALIDSGITPAEAGRRLRVPHTTLRRWMRRKAS